MLASTLTQQRDPLGPPSGRLDRRVVQIEAGGCGAVGHHVELSGEVEILFHHELQRGVGVVGRDDGDDGELRKRRSRATRDGNRTEDAVVRRGGRCFLCAARAWVRKGERHRGERDGSSGADEGTLIRSDSGWCN